ncbi:MAG: septum formation initiator family protein [Candidatus Babeliales bacterium]
MKLIMRNIFFSLELITILFFYFFGTHGLPVLFRTKQENKQVEQEIRQLQEEIVNLEQLIYAWKKYPFYKEKIAREQLQMACADENIYIISKH